MTILTLTRTPSQVAEDQLSRWSEPVITLGSTEGIWSFTTEYCWSQRDTVGARNQIS